MNRNVNRRGKPQAAPRQERPRENTAIDRLVIGRNTLRELLRHAPERIERVLCAESRGESSSRDQLLAEIAERGIRVERCAPERLSLLAGTDGHQGFAAQLRPEPQLSLKDFLDAYANQAGATVLVLDSVEDPHNVGALLRAAECFGVDAVVLSRNRGSPITPAVRKASVGASELVPIIEVPNLVEALRKIKEAQFWVVGAEMGEQAQPVAAFDFAPRTALVLGSEGSGMRALTKSELDFSIKIPLYGRIDSLNVSQAAAVLLYALRQHQPAR